MSNRGSQPSYVKYLEKGVEYIRDNPEKAAIAGLAGLLLLGDSEEKSQYDIQFVIWDVEHGDSMFIDSPGENIVIDLGRHQNGFSPTDYLKQSGIDTIDWLIISHPDKDHIRDIVAFDDRYDISLYTRPDGAAKYIRHRQESVYPNDELYQNITGKFLEFEERRFSYHEPPIDRGQLRVYEFSLSPSELGMTPAHELDTDERGPSLNNLSILHVFEYNGFKLVTMGDLEEDGIELLLERSDVRRALRGTNVLVAPHHGRESSYSTKLFDTISPDLVVVSDAGGTEHSAVQKYSHQASGKTADRRDSDSVVRNVVTTRKDGAIYFGANSSDDYRVTID
ncbi:ComEC/Rec2 family competence protein [Halorubrum sp. FL23]|uniref:ComEC/Rec2 family competence protein n=1 Tax=Halorubrum sp. FL23 TaxID=3458704 RepID=UPI004033173B